MEKYIRISLETHLFFGRIMKEHALFLVAGFPAAETEYRERADWFRQQFEETLAYVVCLADKRAGQEVLDSGEVVTEFTEKAEQQTEKLTGIPIDIQITQAEKGLHAGCPCAFDGETEQQVQMINQRILWLLDGLIALKENILQDVATCSLYTANYPLLLEHIIREAKLYRQIVMELEQNGCISSNDLKATEVFWNQIMMEHAQFIRGLLDPTEYDLLVTADNFAGDFCLLLKEAKSQDCRVTEELTRRTLKTTEKYREFKAAGAEGITSCNIRSVILPLLADHVLREANHYLRILERQGWEE
ncbi:MAG: DUF2935 domain-containing protein [Lachnospiraceae bacterium]|nr:DUF2935 domain-containing protein [Lachnospiraceae bacterium]